MSKKLKIKKISIDPTLPLWMDILPIIFEHLSIYDLCKIRLVSKNFKNLIEQKTIIDLICHGVIKMF